MPVKIDKSVFSAPTARIKIGGDEIGALQDINWTENTNLLRVKGIGSRVDIAQVDGFQEYEITARRAFLNGDAVFTILQPIDINALTTQGFPINITEDVEAEIAAINQSGGLGDLNNSKLLSAIVGTALFQNTVAVSLVFDIEINNNFGQTMFTFNRCKLNMRRSSMTTGSIILSEDLTILARYKTYPSLGSSTLADEISNIVSGENNNLNQ